MAHESNFISAVILGGIVGTLTVVANILIGAYNNPTNPLNISNYSIPLVFAQGFVVGFAAQYIVRWTGVS